MSTTSATRVTEGGVPEGTTRRPLPGNLRYELCVIVAGIVLVLDQATKLLAVETLNLNDPVDSWLPLVEWRLLTNPDAAFGIPGFTGMFLVVTVVVVVLIARALPRADRLSMALAYGLVVGGALGNAGDRVFRGFPNGEVVDFVDIGFWPTFNVADTGIVVGAALIVVLLLRAEREARRGQQANSGRESVRPADGSLRGETAPATAGGTGAASASDDEQEVAADERR